MQLNSDQTAHAASDAIVVEQHAHHVPVDGLDDEVAFGDDVDFVEIVLLDELLQLLAIAERGNGADLLSIADVAEHAAQREESAAAFFVDLASEGLIGV